MKIYISGPITGKPNDNKPAFDAMAGKIKEAGHDPINPHSLPHDHGKTWREYMVEDLKALLDAHAVVFLPGWTESRGARVEYELALSLDMTFSEDLDWIIRK